MKVNGLVSAEDCAKFKDGIVLQGGIQCKPAKITVLAATETESHVFLTIQEGKFHQVKKCFYLWGKSDCFKTSNYGAVAARSAITFRCLSFINKRRVTIAIALFFIENNKQAKRYRVI